MYWIVRKDNPKPEIYIPIFVYKNFDGTRFEDGEKFRVFTIKNEAVNYAKKLQDEFAAQFIRCFYEEGYSEKLK